MLNLQIYLQGASRGKKRFLGRRKRIKVLIVGIGVGSVVILGVMMVTLLMFLKSRRRRRRRRRRRWRRRKKKKKKKKKKEKGLEKKTWVCFCVELAGIYI